MSLVEELAYDVETFAIKLPWPSTFSVISRFSWSVHVALCSVVSWKLAREPCGMYGFSMSLELLRVLRMGSFCIYCSSNSLRNVDRLVSVISVKSVVFDVKV